MENLNTFIQLAHATPEDDTLRLAAADWLEEHGQQGPADFIRVQMQLSRLAVDAPERAALEAQERELLPEMRHFLPEWQQDYRLCTYANRMERGMTLVRGALTDLAGIEPLHLAANPQIRELFVDHAIDEHLGGSIAEAEWFPRINRLLFSYFDDGLRHALRGLFRDNASNLTQVDFIALKNTFRGASDTFVISPSELFYSDACSHIERIRYDEQEITPAGVYRIRPLLPEENQRIHRIFMREYTDHLQSYIAALQEFQQGILLPMNHIFCLLNLREVNGIPISPEVVQMQQQALAIAQELGPPFYLEPDAEMHPGAVQPHQPQPHQPNP